MRYMTFTASTRTVTRSVHPEYSHTLATHHNKQPLVFATLVIETKAMTQQSE